jgi:arginyl-tRNA synthetase
MDIHPIIARALQLVAQLDSSNILSLLETPKDADNGDLAFPCFVLAKSWKKSPVDIAKNIVAQIENHKNQSAEFASSVEKIEARGPYVNFFYRQSNYFQGVVTEVLQQDGAYGNSTQGQGQVVVIDYSSPNIAKPFSIGHLRSTNIGNAIKNIWRSQGTTVIGINHLGDWGMQFAKLMLAQELWGDAHTFVDDATGKPVQKLLKLYVRYHQEAKSDNTLDARAAVLFSKLEGGDLASIQLWKQFVEAGLAECREIYRLLDIEFEYLTGESFFNDKMDAMVDELVKRGVANQSEGALVIDLESFGMPPFLLKKSDGTTLYATRDLAALLYRQQTTHFTQVLYVVGSEQKLHFQQLFKVAEILGYPWAKTCKHVEFGLIHFKDGAMSTREGKVIFLKDVIDQAVALARKTIEAKNPSLENIAETAQAVGIGAIRFFDLASKRCRDIQFDWEEILSFEGETGPYLLYTHVRLAALLAKGGYSISELLGISPNSGPLAEEFTLSKIMAQFSNILENSARECEPSFLAQYLISLAKAFNHYYHVTRIVDAQNVERTQQRLQLVLAVKIVLAKGLKLLGLTPVERM